MTQRFQSLRGLRILVIEDDFLIAAELEDILHELHCTVVGPAGSIASALDACRRAHFDGATLDMNLRGQGILPVVAALATRGTPFLLVTGYPSHGGEFDALRAARRVSKPFSLDSLGAAMVDVFTGASGEAGPPPDASGGKADRATCG